MKLLIFILLIVASPTYPLSYDSAIYKAQKGNWQDAHSTLNSIITDNPDRADVMYDAGVAAYNLGNKCQAATCFTRAAECSSDKNIAFCAHFNAGNTYVDEKKLERALAEYDKALAIEPDNEYARHNRDRVKQMLEEQKQQENKQDDQQKQEQDKDQEKDEQNQDDKQDQDKQENKQDQKDGNDQQNQDGNDSSSAKASADRQKDGRQNQNGNDRQKNDSSQDESLNQQSQGDRDQRDAADNSKNTQRQKHGDNKKEQHQNSTDNKKRDGKDKFDKQSQDAQKEGNKQQGDKHGTTPGQQNIGDDKSNVSAEDGQEQAITDPWLLRILNDQEMHDKAVNKQLMEAKIRQHGGKNGQNCW